MNTTTDLTHGIAGALSQIMANHFGLAQKLAEPKTRTVEYSIEIYRTVYDHANDDSEQETVGYHEGFEYDLKGEELAEYNRLYEIRDTDASEYLEEILDGVECLQDYEGYPNLHIQIDRVGEES